MKILKPLVLSLVIGLLGISLAFAQVPLKAPYDTYGLCPHLSWNNIYENNGFDVIEAGYLSDYQLLELPITPFNMGPNVIAFQQSPAFNPGTPNGPGDLLLELRKATLYEDNEGNLEHPFLEGGAWSNIYIEVVSEAGDVLDRMVLKGPFLSDNDQCEWGDTDVSYYPQIAHYGNYGLYNWTQGRATTVHLLFFESDEFDLTGWRKTYMGDFTIEIDQTKYPAKLVLKDTDFAGDNINDLDIIVQTRDLTAYIEHLPGDPTQPPQFEVLTGSNRYFVIEIATNPELFVDTANRNTGNFFTSQSDGFLDAGDPINSRHSSGYQPPQDSWQDLLASGSKTFYYRLITMSDLEKRDFQTSLWDTQWSDAPSFSIP